MLPRIVRSPVEICFGTSQPGAEVAAFAEHLAGADRGDHRDREDLCSDIAVFGGIEEMAGDLSVGRGRPIDADARPD
jgi:hypothetical protein